MTTRISHHDEDWDLDDAPAHIARAREILDVPPEAGEPIEWAMQNRVIAFEHVCRAGIIAVEEQIDNATSSA